MVCGVKQSMYDLYYYLLIFLCQLTRSATTGIHTQKQNVFNVCVFEKNTVSTCICIKLYTHNKYKVKKMHYECNQMKRIQFYDKQSGKYTWLLQAQVGKV